MLPLLPTLVGDMSGQGPSGPASIEQLCLHRLSLVHMPSPVSVYAMPA
jgi:hypothetical protein